IAIAPPAGIPDSQSTSNVAQAGSGGLSAAAGMAGRDASGLGGGINNTGSLTVTGSTFRHNQAIGGNDSSSASRPGLGAGGAILSGGPPGAPAPGGRGRPFAHQPATGGHTESATTTPPPPR